MRETSVRLSWIEIRNFKNVVYGRLSFENTRKNYSASVLGLYGQNGSGKTALIDALQLLQYLLRGRPVPARYTNFINVDADHAEITYAFRIKKDGKTVPAIYQVSMKAVKDTSDANTQEEHSGENYFKPVIYDEILKCDILSDKKVKLGRMVDTHTEDIFLPRPKRILLIGKDRKVYTDLLVAKKMAAETSRSFIFSRELLEAIRKNAGALRKNPEERADAENERIYYYRLLERLVYFGNYELFIINTENSGMISINMQPVSFKYEEAGAGALGTILLPLDRPVAVPVREKSVIEKVVSLMSTVLGTIIPGLAISVNDLGAETLKNGNEGRRIELISRRNGKEIPLRYESEGIKKIVSILQLLIVVYNNPSITLAVDELDSGIFEYLLGELLRIISEKGKGQLIFTSHNLRPLETLDKGFVAFTTTNPENRYIRLTNVKENNNLRDFYYRDITLGEQNEELYDHTNNAEIAFAFREAGEANGS